MKHYIMLHDTINVVDIFPDHGGFICSRVYSIFKGTIGDISTEINNLHLTNTFILSSFDQ